MLASGMIEAGNGARTGVNDGVLGNDTVLGRIGFHDLKLHGPHSTTDKERVTLADGSIR